MNEEIRGQMIEIHHSWGHPGIDKTLELMTQNYWWPGMKKDIQKYIASCNTCQTVKPNRQAKTAPLHPNEIPEGPLADNLDGYDGSAAGIERL